MSMLCAWEEGTWQWEREGMVPVFQALPHEGGPRFWETPGHVARQLDAKAPKREAACKPTEGASQLRDATASPREKPWLGSQGGVRSLGDKADQPCCGTTGFIWR